MDRLKTDGESSFKREFDQLDKGNGVVEMRDMPRLIEGVLGRNVRPWIKDRILKMFEANRDGKVSWLDLQDGLRKVMQSTRKDVSFRKRNLPEWLVSNRQVHTQRAGYDIPPTKAFKSVYGGLANFLHRTVFCSR